MLPILKLLLIRYKQLEFCSVPCHSEEAETDGLNYKYTHFVAACFLLVVYFYELVWEHSVLSCVTRNGTSVCRSVGSSMIRYLGNVCSQNMNRAIRIVHNLEVVIF